MLRFPLIALLLLPVSAAAQPSGESVQSGSASFQRQGADLTVHQNSRHAIIHWQDFSVAAGSQTRFVQPDADSAVLNRVVSLQPSQIDGLLSANGNVYLINPNGIVIGAQGRIEANGFLGSTLDPDNEQAFADINGLRFSGDSQAAVINLGRIDAAAGDIVLLARRVENHGELQAGQGDVLLAAANDIYLQAKGADERIYIARAEGSDAVVINDGYIQATRAELQAVGGNPFALAVNHSGVIEAVTVSREGGRVLLKAGQGATVVNGDILAQGRVGGGIDVLGDTVLLGERTRLAADGEQGGGQIRVGGDFQGQNPLVKNAAHTVVRSGARLSATATELGDAGRVIVWADDSTAFAGHIDVRALGENGNGGFAEVSGKQVLAFAGDVDLDAANGSPGELLLDPFDIVGVMTRADLNNAVLIEEPLDQLNGSTGFVGFVSVEAIQEALNQGGRVTLSANNRIGFDIIDLIVPDGAVLVLDAPSVGLADATIRVQGSGRVEAPDIVELSGASVLEIGNAAPSPNPAPQPTPEPPQPTPTAPQPAPGQNITVDISISNDADGRLRVDGGRNNAAERNAQGNSPARTVVTQIPSGVRDNRAVPVGTVVNVRSLRLPPELTVDGLIDYLDELLDYAQTGGDDGVLVYAYERLHALLLANDGAVLNGLDIGQPLHEEVAELDGRSVRGTLRPEAVRRDAAELISFLQEVSILLPEQQASVDIRSATSGQAIVTNVTNSVP